MDIGKAFVESWNIYIKNFIIILLASIVSTLLGFLIAPTIGLQYMFVKAKRGNAVAFNDVFAPFGRFFSVFFGGILIGVLILLCFVPAMVCSYLNWNTLAGILAALGAVAVVYLGVCWIFSLMLVYDKGLSIIDGLKTSRAMVTKNGWWLHFLLLVLVGIVAGIGNMLWGVGFLLTMPLGVGAIASAYADEAK